MWLGDDIGLVNRIKGEEEEESERVMVAKDEIMSIELHVFGWRN